ncbi:MAG: hypothetical protein HRU06_17745 [Oceanospirillaceae bacterium]|nr:hypothetical protein [Oceanospirillaceae bacterium]
MKVKKIILMTAVATVLAACGGGSGSTEESAGTVSVLGTPTKGVMYNAKVTARQLVGGVFVNFTPSLSTQTDDSTGAYSLAIPADYTGVVKITTESVAATQMLCDFTGCGGNFGDRVSLSAGFTMNAIVPNVSGQTVTVNPNILTHLAAAEVENSTITPESVTTASQKLARTYGITGDLASIASVDITSAAKVNSADKNAVLVNMLSAAMMATVFSQNNTGSLNDALQVLTTDFATNNGTLLEKDTTSSKAVSRNDINVAMTQLLSDMSSKATVDGLTINKVAEINLELTQEKSKLDLILASDSVRETIPDADPLAQATALVKSKAMVDELRLLGNSIQLGTSDKFNHLELGIKSFADEIDSIAITKADFEADLEFIALALEESIRTLATGYENDPTLDSYIVSATNAAGTVSDLSVYKFSEWQEQSANAPLIRSAGITGTVTTASGLTLTIEDNSAIQYDLVDYSDSSITFIYVEQAQLLLTASLETATARFSGEFKIFFRDTLVQDDYYDENYISEFGSANIYLGGVFETNIDTDSPSGMYAALMTYLIGDKVTDQEATEASVNNYVVGGAALEFATSIPGITGVDEAFVRISGENHDFDTGTVTVQIEYDTTRFIFSVSNATDQDVLTVVNQNDVTLTVTENSNGDISGHISVSGIKTANIVDGIITFTDGYLESL